jgi:hypothetical protein
MRDREFGFADGDFGERACGELFNRASVEPRVRCFSHVELMIEGFT